ncbi:SDR family NAD(P)-dependent oxidoreductase [Anaerosolibacter sp.]|uniref:SDR family NAD(P)-dependent oxidoreductase n=1 Tax=Anaerosolibacter sp. TaxID=1872527 RepID=UPI0039EEFBD0
MIPKILITGGAGFIGSHLCQKLLEQNISIIVLDNFNDYYPSQMKLDNIEDLRAQIRMNEIDEEKLTVIRGDIRDSSLLDRLFNDHRIDMVIHLAAMAGVRPSIKEPELYYDVNMKGTLNLLEACSKYQVSKFIFASSSSVYGNNKKVPFSESDNVDFPISPYAATKKAGELLCHTYHSLYKLDIVCLRFFTVYGPRQRPDLAIHKFTKLIVNNKEVPFFGDGSTERDYTYIDDIITGILATIKWLKSSTNVFEIFNLGGSRTISLRHMVKTIEEEVGKNAILNHQPMQSGDVMKTYADISKSKRMLGYEPKTRFELGISEFIKWYNERNGRSR